MIAIRNKRSNILPILLAMVLAGTSCGEKEPNQIAVSSTVLTTDPNRTSDVGYHNGSEHSEPDNTSNTDEIQSNGTPIFDENGNVIGWKSPDWTDDEPDEYNPVEMPTAAELTKQRERTKAKAAQAFVFARNNGMNTDFCVLIDMSISIGWKRFFVYDFNLHKVIFSCLVIHGYGLSSTYDKPEFSNVHGSNCTSLGKYKIGIRSYSNWGIHVHYKLHGLESTNSNAYRRLVVLHSYSPVPCEETRPEEVGMCSEGCPIICDEAMEYMDKKLRNVTKPVLLWIYK